MSIESFKTDIILSQRSFDKIKQNYQTRKTIIIQKRIKMILDDKEENNKTDIFKIS